MDATADVCVFNHLLRAPDRDPPSHGLEGALAPPVIPGTSKGVAIDDCQQTRVRFRKRVHYIEPGFTSTRTSNSVAANSAASRRSNETCGFSPERHTGCAESFDGECAAIVRLRSRHRRAITSSGFTGGAWFPQLVRS